VILQMTEMAQIRTRWAKVDGHISDLMGDTMSAPNHSTNATNGASGVNGHAHESPAEVVISPPPPHIATLLEELQVPFDAPLVKWRANETKIVQRRMYGLCLPYADPRAYKDRLNFLVSPTGWRDKFAITTTATKILVTCELSVDHLGCHSATGEEWSKNENAATSAEAQSFKRACAGFGLGRYFYYFAGLWLALDHKKRTEANPPLPEWATPEGWRRGLRPLPNPTPEPPQSGETVIAQISDREIVGRSKGTSKNVVHEIRAMEPVIGASLYRGLLKTVARVWNPADIRELSQQRRVLQHMEAAHRGILRIETALTQLNKPAATEIFRSLDLTCFNDIRDLDIMHRLIVALEKAASLIP
jgi:hypothetical protein